VPNDLVAVLPLVGIALLFWLLIVRPASRRQQRVRSLQQSLEVGNEVVLAAGLYGIIRSVDDDRIGLEVADGVIVTAARGAVLEVVGAERSN
jgi:preprotein translocase subunit YajC